MLRGIHLSCSRPCPFIIRTVPSTFRPFSSPSYLPHTRPIAKSKEKEKEKDTKRTIKEQTPKKPDNAATFLSSYMNNLGIIETFFSSLLKWSLAPVLPWTLVFKHSDM